MSNRNGAPGSKGFFREKCGAGAMIGSIFLLLFLLFILVAVFTAHTVASVFEQRGLQNAMETFLKSDEVRNEVAETIRDTFPEEFISDTQVEELIHDDVILEAASQYLYEAIHFEDGSVDFYDYMLGTLEDPSSAALYSEALDRFTQALGIDDETYREAAETVAEKLEMELPEGETDKLALATAIMHTVVEENREQLPELTLDSILSENSGFSDVFSAAQKALVLFETPRFILYNLLLLVFGYGLILLFKRNYRKPLLDCAIPYFAVGLMLLVASSLLSLVLSLIGKPGGVDISAFADIASGAILRSALIAFAFALPLLIAYILLTVLKRKRSSGTAKPKEAPVAEREIPEASPASIPVSPAAEAPAADTTSGEDGAAVAKAPEELSL